MLSAAWDARCGSGEERAGDQKSARSLVSGGLRLAQGGDCPSDRRGVRKAAIDCAKPARDAGGGLHTPGHNHASNRAMYQRFTACVSTR